MTVRAARGDHQVISDTGFTVQINDNEIFGLVIIERTIHECQQFLACRWLLAYACYGEWLLSFLMVCILTLRFTVDG